MACRSKPAFENLDNLKILAILAILTILGNPDNLDNLDNLGRWHDARGYGGGDRGGRCRTDMHDTGDNSIVQTRLSLLDNLSTSVGKSL